MENKSVMPLKKKLSQLKIDLFRNKLLLKKKLIKELIDNNVRKLKEDIYRQKLLYKAKVIKLIKENIKMKCQCKNERAKNLKKFQEHEKNGHIMIRNPSCNIDSCQSADRIVPICTRSACCYGVQNKIVETSKHNKDNKTKKLRRRCKKHRKKNIRHESLSPISSTSFESTSQNTYYEEINSDETFSDDDVNNLISRTKERGIRLPSTELDSIFQQHVRHQSGILLESSCKCQTPDRTLLDTTNDDNILSDIGDEISCYTPDTLIVDTAEPENKCMDIISDEDSSIHTDDTYIISNHAYSQTQFKQEDFHKYKEYSDDAAYINSNHTYSPTDFKPEYSDDAAYINSNHIYSPTDFKPECSDNAAYINSNHTYSPTDFKPEAFDDSANINSNHTYSPTDFKPEVFHDTAYINSNNTYSPTDFEPDLFHDTAYINSNNTYSPTDFEPDLFHDTAYINSNNTYSPTDFEPEVFDESILIKESSNNLYQNIPFHIKTEVEETCYDSIDRNVFENFEDMKDIRVKSESLDFSAENPKDNFNLYSWSSN